MLHNLTFQKLVKLHIPKEWWPEHLLLAYRRFHSHHRSGSRKNPVWSAGPLAVVDMYRSS